MTDHSEGKTLMVRYILGEVSPKERADFEARYQADSDLFEELIAAENDLIDSYARGELSSPDRVQFEKRFLETPELRERVDFAKSLAGHISAPAQPQASPGWWKFIVPGSAAAPVARFAFSAVVLGLLLWGVWLTTSNVRLRSEAARMAAERDRLVQQQNDFQTQLAKLNAQLKELEDNPPAQGFAQLGRAGTATISLVLSPGLARSPGSPRVLPASPAVPTTLLLLKIRPVPYSIFNISLETPEGKQVLKREGLQAWSAGGEKMVPVSFPSTALQRGDYILRLIGQAGGKSEEVDAYGFRVVAR